MSARLAVVGVAVMILVLALPACSERPKVYKPVQYQGKTDSLAWDNDQFKGNRVEWEKALKARSQGQDEYARSAPGAR